jgi:hypothetical protein
MISMAYKGSYISVSGHFLFKKWFYFDICMGFILWRTRIVCFKSNLYFSSILVVSVNSISCKRSTCFKRTVRYKNVNNCLNTNIYPIYQEILFMLNTRAWRWPKLLRPEVPSPYFDSTPTLKIMGLFVTCTINQHLPLPN